MMSGGLGDPAAKRLSLPRTIARRSDVDGSVSPGLVTSLSFAGRPRLPEAVDRFQPGGFRSL